LETSPATTLPGAAAGGGSLYSGRLHTARGPGSLLQGRTDDTALCIQLHQAVRLCAAHAVWSDLVPGCGRAVLSALAAALLAVSPIAPGDARRNHSSRLSGPGLHALESLSDPLRRALVATLLRTGYATGRFCGWRNAGYLSPPTARLVSIPPGPWCAGAGRLRADSTGSLRHAP